MTSFGVVNEDMSSEGRRRRDAPRENETRPPRGFTVEAFKGGRRICDPAIDTEKTRPADGIRSQTKDLDIDHRRVICNRPSESPRHESAQTRFGRKGILLQAAPRGWTRNSRVYCG